MLRAGRFSGRKSEVQQSLAVRHGGFQPATGRGVVCLALEREHRFAMPPIARLLLTIIAARMAGDLTSAVQDADGDIGSYQRERPTDRFRRNRIVIEVETDVDRYAPVDAFDAVGVEA